MAEGALRHADAQLSIAVTGVAGPGGGTATKPVGLVHLASTRAGAATRHERQLFDGDRAAIRMASVACALRLLAAQAHGA
jgi:nicotinamide-nucleotide amidase